VDKLHVIIVLHCVCVVKIEFNRINISTRNEDGYIGELIIPTERLYSFGVSENTSQETGNVTGFTFPLCLWSRDGVTPAEKTWCKFLVPKKTCYLFVCTWRGIH
jgi:hypothetical protein